jgi:hypothetical protein
MSALPPKADIGTQPRDVRFVPKADILHCGKERRYSITSSPVASSETWIRAQIGGGGLSISPRSSGMAGNDMWVALEQVGIWSN